MTVKKAAVSLTPTVSRPVSLIKEPPLLPATVHSTSWGTPTEPITVALSCWGWPTYTSPSPAGLKETAVTFVPTACSADTILLLPEASSGVVQRPSSL